MANADDNHC